MSSVLYSIITPVYNSSSRISICIDSVLSQTNKDWELILIDDGSTDDSLSICQSYASRDTRIKVVAQKNAGASSARNKGLAYAIGKYIMFLDSDDTLPSNAGELLLMGFCDSSTILSISGYSINDEDGRNITCFLPQAENLCLEEAIKEMFEPISGFYQGYICSKMYKKKIIDEIGLSFDDDIYYNEDRLFCIKYMALASYGNVQYIPGNVYNYCQCSNGAMASLKRVFNYKAITDLIAMQRIKCIIESQFPKNKVLISCTKSAICVSYNRITSMMNDYRIINWSLEVMLMRLICKELRCQGVKRAINRIIEIIRIQFGEKKQWILHVLLP